MNILLTGASGFLGSALENSLLNIPWINLTVALRFPRSGRYASIQHIVGSIDGLTDWTSALWAQDAVIHTAARAHVMNEHIEAPLVEYRRVNVEGTLCLARQAAAAGVKRFIFLSSIKVNGEYTELGKSFSPYDKPAPLDAYAQSKWEAEQGLFEISVKTGMEVVVIRSPLIYGPGAKGNFASMVGMVGLGLPLPLGSIHNKRTLVGIDNLIDLITCCIDHPAAANQVLLAGDGQDISTTELLRAVGQSMGQPVRLLPLPAGILQWSAVLLGKGALAQRLLSSLQADISHTRELLGWTPPLTLEEGLRRCFVPI